MEGEKLVDYIIYIGVLAGCIIGNLVCDYLRDLKRNYEMKKLERVLKEKGKLLKKYRKDRVSRIIRLSEMEEILKEWKGTCKKQELHNLLVILFYSIKNLEREHELEESKIDKLNDIFERINVRITEREIYDIIEDLIQEGFQPLPKFRGLAELYKNQELI